MSKIIIVPVSGGKDSQVVLSTSLKTGKQVVCVHQNTGWDHPDTYQQLKDMETFYGVTIEHTVSKHKDMIQFLETAKYFPNNLARGCTRELKQEPFANWLIENKYDATNCEIWFGMRSGESASRASKYGGLLNTDTFTLNDISSWYSKGKRIKHLGRIPVKLPIVEWSTEEVFDYIREEGAPINPLYAVGHARVGCFPCLLARKADWVRVGQDPLGKKNIQKLVDIEDRWAMEGNPRKSIKVHKVWDVRKFIEEDTESLPEAEGECGWCSI